MGLLLLDGRRNGRRCSETHCRKAQPGSSAIEAAFGARDSANDDCEGTIAIAIAIASRGEGAYTSIRTRARTGASSCTGARAGTRAGACNGACTSANASTYTGCAITGASIRGAGGQCGWQHQCSSRYR